MLLDFYLGNYRSYRNVRKFTLIASTDNTHLDNNLTTIKVPYGDKDRTINVLKSAVIYGANASGKSNLLNGIKFMKGFIFNSSKNMQRFSPFLGNQLGGCHIVSPTSGNFLSTQPLRIQYGCVTIVPYLKPHSGQ